MHNYHVLKITSIIAILYFLIACVACQGQKDFTDKRIVIKKDETVRIKELGLSIINQGCGRKWVSEGDKPSYERAYCDLQIKQGDSTFSAGSDFEPIRIGKIQIQVEKMNPWGREEDSIPPGGCQVYITRLQPGTHKP